MLDSTKEVLKTVLRQDHTITPERRLAIMTAASDAPKVQTKPECRKKLYRRAEVAEKFGRAPRTVDDWCARGWLTKVYARGSKLALGIDADSVEALLIATAPAPTQQPTVTE